jgi:hypothetical protein
MQVLWITDIIDFRAAIQRHKAKLIVGNLYLVRSPHS